MRRRPALLWPLAASVVMHGGFATALWVVPSPKPSDRRAAIELTDRELPKPQVAPNLPPPPPDPPPPPKEQEIERPVKRRKVARPERVEVVPEPAKVEPPSGDPAADQPPAVDTGAKTFGLEMEGATAAPGGGGVAVPRGDTLRTNPAVKRIAKGKPRKPSGFRQQYAPGEPAPIAVVTKMPKVVARAVPGYPQRIRDLGLEGQVVVSLKIDGRGKVAAARVLRGLHPVLDREALAAARKTTFEPAEVNGVAVSVTISFIFTFVLD